MIHIMHTSPAAVFVYTPALYVMLVSEVVFVRAVCVFVCVCQPLGFYQLVCNVSVVVRDPLITLLPLLFRGAIKDTSGYQGAARQDWQA